MAPTAKEVIGAMIAGAVILLVGLIVGFLAAVLIAASVRRDEE